MTQPDNKLLYSRLLLLIVAVGALVYLIMVHIRMSWNIFLAVMGFSAVVFIHECGHFLVAKASDIKIEVFSVFLPPILCGIRRTEAGWRCRILPTFFPRVGDPNGDGLLSFTFGRPGRSGETEYRIGLIPIAGYVRMLGQDDIGADKQVSDPRSFGNKSTGVRMAVIAAGVIFNVITAVAIMTTVYLVGIRQVPAVVGSVIPDSPADRAGLEAGDRIIEISGKRSHLDFMDIPVAAALSNKGQAVSLSVQKPDGSIKKVSMVAQEMSDIGIRLFGIGQPQSLTVAQVADPDLLKKRTGLQSGDRIIAVNDIPVQHHWELEHIINLSSTPTVTVTAERTDPVSGETKHIESILPVEMNVTDQQISSESNLNHVYSMVPLVQVATVENQSSSADPNTSLQPEDVILAAGDIAYPTFHELRDVTTAFEDKDLPLQILRTNPNGTEHTLTVLAHPKRSPGSNRVMIGISVKSDGADPIVAKTLSLDDPYPMQALDIPRGATITSIANHPVSSFYDIIRLIQAYNGQRINILWSKDDRSGKAVLNVQDPQHFVTMRASLAEFIPFEYLQELYKSDTLADAFVNGCRKSVWFIKQTYVTVKQLIARRLSVKAMTGPVGIATIAYQTVKHSFIDFLYLLALISANLAVINFLPIPVVDGGVFTLLIIEKIKGGPLSLRTQEIITYAGLALIATLFLYLTYNDILRLIT